MKIPHFGSLSLTSRLTVFYTISTIAILLIAVVFQFLALVSDLEFEDNDFLSDKIKVLQAMISKSPNNPSILDEEIHWETAMRDYTRYMVRVMDKDGKVLLETARMGHLLPSGLFPPPAKVGTAVGRGKKRASSDGRIYLVNSAWAAAAGDKHFRLLQISLDVTDDEQLLDGYRKKMLFIFLAGIALSAGLSIFIARRGLKPLEDITEKAEKITAEILHERISERVWPRELAKLANAFDGMLNRLEGSFTKLTEFSANLAHELRTPINNLMGEAEVAVSRSRSSEEYRRVIESSLEEYHRLSGMIDNILFLARSETEVSPVLIDARREVDLLCDFYSTLAEEKGITLSCNGEGNVCADPPLFQRAVGNLISNAIRYTPGGSIAVSLVSETDGRLNIIVEDTGIGIAPGDLQRIFDRFYRSEAARALHAQGSGLGLSIVKTIMELHHGSVDISSIPGKGTTAALHFPPTPC